MSVPVEIISPDITPVPYASFSRRATAFGIDQFILMTILIVLMLPVVILFGIAQMFVWPFFVIILPTVGSMAVPAIWLYFALQESSKYQATWGKRMCGIKVTDMQGQRITFLRATVRHFMKYVSAAVMMIGFIMAAFTEKHQALHDLVAETLVVKKG